MTSNANERCEAFRVCLCIESESVRDRIYAEIFRGIWNMKKISSYIWDYRLSYLGAVLSLLIAVTLDMAAPRLTARVVDDVIVGGNMGELKFLHETA